MIVACPACSKKFRVDPAQIGAGGRQVKCGSCGNVWYAASPDFSTVLEDVDHDVSAAIDRFHAEEKTF